LDDEKLNTTNLTFSINGTATPSRFVYGARDMRASLASPLKGLMMEGDGSSEGGQFCFCLV